VIALVKLVVTEDMKDTRIAFNARRMKVKTIKQVRDAPKLGIPSTAIPSLPLDVRPSKSRC
jgi:hypothetical protein